MTQDNDPWGNSPRNTEGGDFTSLINKLKNSLFGDSSNQGGSSRPPSDNPRQPFSGIPKKAIPPVLALVVVGWVSTGIYILPEGFHGVELTFGRYSETATQPGFNLRKPFPIGSVTKVDIGSLHNLTVGSRNDNSEGQMLTSDENIVEVSLSVQYKVGEAHKYLFNVNNPVKVLRESLISSIREVVGASTVDYVLTDGRAEWPAKVRDNLIKTLEGFDVGFDVARVELRDAKAPAAVQDAFDDAVKAREDAERYKLQAEAYQNKQVPLARGEATRILEQALGYKEATIAKATGEAERFNEILKTYRLAPEVTRDRLYIETLQQVYQNVNNIVVATGDNPPMMYLPMGGQPTPLLPPPTGNNEINELGPQLDDDKDNGYQVPKQSTTRNLNKRLTR